MQFFLSSGLYGERKATHLSAYHIEPGHLFICFGSRTLEVDYDHTSRGAQLCLKVASLFTKSKGNQHEHSVL